jgi:hypothetical protein
MNLQHLTLRGRISQLLYRSKMGKWAKVELRACWRIPSFTPHEPPKVPVPTLATALLALYNDRSMSMHPQASLREEIFYAVLASTRFLPLCDLPDAEWAHL